MNRGYSSIPSISIQVSLYVGTQYYRSLCLEEGLCKGTSTSSKGRIYGLQHDDVVACLYPIG